MLLTNRAGAGSTVGTAAAAKATPDGYTLVAVTTTTVAAATAVYPKLGYNPATDFEPIGLIGATPFVLVVPPSLRLETYAAFVQCAKANPGKLNYGSIGSGSASHLVAELFKKRTGIEMTHIPYRGAAPAQTDLMGGQIQAVFDNPTALVQQVRAGRMKALGISERSPSCSKYPPLCR